MGCTHTVQCLISEDIMQDSEELLKTGEFSSFAELANHAIRCFAEAIQFGFTTGPYVRMKGTQPKNVRVEKYPMDVLKERCGLKSYEIADYALDWYINSYRNGRMEPIPQKRMG